MDSYTLSRNFWDWSFENPEKISPNHSAIFFFAVEHCNRLGWKEKFGFPTQMAMDAVGIKKHGTYIKYFNDLIDWKFLILVQKSTNQYSANIISLSHAKLKNGKALDKAFVKHAAKHIESNGQSNSSIDKQVTINQFTNKQGKVFFNEKLKLEFEFYPKEETARYGNRHMREQGGMGTKAIADHCLILGIKYTEGDEYA